MRALLLVFCLFLSSPATAATSPVGLWRLDEGSLDTTLDQLMVGILAGTPAEQQADVRAMMEEQREDMKVEMTKSMAATIEFAQDGSVIFNDPQSPDTERGAWRFESERLVVTDEDPISPDMVGSVQPGRIELSFRIDRTDPEQGMLGDLVWVLVPVR